MGFPPEPQHINIDVQLRLIRKTDDGGGGWDMGRWSLTGQQLLWLTRKPFPTHTSARIFY